MAIDIGVAARNASVDAVCALTNSGQLCIFNGTKPATPLIADAGTLLCAITMPASAFNAASGGTAIAKSISNGAVVVSGVATYFRMKSPPGPSQYVIWQGSITKAGVGTPGDLTVSEIDFVEGGLVAVTSLSYSQPQ